MPTTRRARARAGAAAGAPGGGLHAQDRSAAHWALDYARRLADRHPAHHRILIQTSMSPTGYFHIGNFRDTVCAHLVHRALTGMGRRSAILLSFDDYDPVRESQAARDPELAGYGGRPLAAHRERATRICRAYLAELRAVGILPADADEDGRTPPGSPWETHYQFERYRAGEYRERQRRLQRDAGRLADLLGKDDGRDLFAVYCLQCGRNDTEIHELGAAAARYRCLSCGAELTARDPAVVKPSWAVDWALRVVHEHIDCEPAGQDHCSAGSTMDRTRPVYDRYLRRPQPVIVPYGLVRGERGGGKVSGSRGGGPYVRDLLAVYPPVLVLWLYARGNCLSDFRLGFGPGAFFGAYDAFDRFVRAAEHRERARVLWELLGDEARAGRAALPRMRSVVGALYSHGGRTAPALRHLERRHPEAAGELLAERVRHARDWLSTHGHRRYWGAPDAAAGGRGRTDTSGAAEAARTGPAVATLIDGLRTHDGPGAPRAARTREDFREIYGALFGTAHGPRLDTLADALGPAVLADALAAYRDHGRRPLLGKPFARPEPVLQEAVPHAG
ncbi:lysine--tRNA ligase [Streptomyces sp. NPDC014735]|uniref:lysine--tRNA ligase n=1 Tax=unclassified Streptomyces TaxID=2593676 RepID=UPI0036FA16A1